MHFVVYTFNPWKQLEKGGPILQWEELVLRMGWAKNTISEEFSLISRDYHHARIFSKLGSTLKWK